MDFVKQQSTQARETKNPKQSLRMFYSYLYYELFDHNVDEVLGPSVLLGYVAVTYIFIYS